jgi:hypothetical protein
MSADAFTERLDVLEAAGQMSSATRIRVERLVSEVEAAFAVSLEERNGAMFVTHVALSLERARRGEPAPPVPDLVRTQAAGLEAERRFAAHAAGPGLPDEEVDLWAIHLAAIRETAA